MTQYNAERHPATRKNCQGHFHTGFVSYIGKIWLLQLTKFVVLQDLIRMMDKENASIVTDFTVQ